jgi:hypothetical protein
MFSTISRCLFLIVLSFIFAPKAAERSVVGMYSLRKKMQIFCSDFITCAKMLHNLGPTYFLQALAVLQYKAKKRSTVNKKVQEVSFQSILWRKVRNFNFLCTDSASRVEQRDIFGLKMWAQGFL